MLQIVDTHTPHLYHIRSLIIHISVLYLFIFYLCIYMYSPDWTAMIEPMHIFAAENYVQQPLK